MKIDSIKLKSLHNDGHFQFHTEFRDLVNTANPETLKIETLFNGFLTLYNREDEALKKIVSSPLTPKIHEADAARDETLSGLTDVVKGMCKHYTPSVRDAARRVQVVLNTYKHTASKSINEETSAIYNLVQELKSAKYIADIQAIGVAGLVDELARRNNVVEALVKERYNENAAKTDIVLREARLKVDAAYKDICEIIDARAIVEGPAAYETFIRTLNEVIKKYAIKYRRRGKKNAAGAAGETEGTEGTEG